MPLIRTISAQFGGGDEKCQDFHPYLLESMVGVEPTMMVLQTRALTTWRHRHYELVGDVRIELT